MVAPIELVREKLSQKEMDYIVLKRKRPGMTQGTHASQNLLSLELLHMIFH